MIDNNELKEINSLVSSVKLRLNEYRILYHYLEVDIITLEVSVFITEKNNLVNVTNFSKVNPNVKIIRKYVKIC